MRGLYRVRSLYGQRKRLQENRKEIIQALMELEARFRVWDDFL